MGRKRSAIRDINAVERARLAIQLRKQGLTLDDIAAQCGYSDRSGAHRAITRALERAVMEEANELRTLELMRLDEMFAECYALFMDRENKGRLFALDRLLAISKARRELSGLDKRIDEQASQQNYVKRIILTHDPAISPEEEAPQT